MKTTFNLAEKYRRENTEMAAIILANPEKHGGPGSLSVEWARLFQLNQREKPSGPRGQQNLFQGEAA